MLIGAGHTDLPVFDTTRIHAEAAMEFALAETPVADVI
jgi:aspartate racemase